MELISANILNKQIDIHFLSCSPIFRGLTEEEIKTVLPCLKATYRSFVKDEFIYRAGDQIRSIGVLLSGKVSIENDDLWGNKTILNMITPGNIFAETYACIPSSQLMVNVVAVEKSDVLYLDTSHLLETCSNNCSFHNKLIRNLLSISAQKNLNLSRRSFHTSAKTIRGRCFHTSAKTIRGRMLSYLSYEAAKNGSYEFDIPFNRQQLADYLGLDRSALSNELSKMTKDGYITVSRNHFVIVNKELDF